MNLSIFQWPVQPFFGNTSTNMMYLNVSDQKFFLSDVYIRDQKGGPTTTYHRRGIGSFLVMLTQKISYLVTGRYDLVLEAYRSDEKGALLFYEKLLFDVVPKDHYSVKPLYEKLEEVLIHKDTEWVHCDKPIYLVHPLVHKFDIHGYNAIPTAILTGWKTVFGPEVPVNPEVLTKRYRLGLEALQKSKK